MIKDNVNLSFFLSLSLSQKGQVSIESNSAKVPLLGRQDFHSLHQLMLCHDHRGWSRDPPSAAGGLCGARSLRLRPSFDWSSLGRRGTPPGLGRGLAARVQLVWV